MSASLEERELALLREAVDTAQTRQGRNKLRDPGMQRIIGIVEEFLRSTRLICYGGTAINNILPQGHQFYDKNTEFPDYDFYSPDALQDAKALANIYSSEGFDEVEAKAAVHHGTYKVYVNFVPVADITQLPASLYKSLAAEAIVIKGIRYAPPDFLRMSMYLELSRPDGDVSRWEKVHKRLSLLNKFYPMRNPMCNFNTFSRVFEGGKKSGQTAFSVIRKEAGKQGMLFFGGYAASLYRSKGKQPTGRQEPDFDLLAEDAADASKRIEAALKDANVGKVKTKRYKAIWEVVPASYEIMVDDDIVCAVYQTVACHNYNIVDVGGHGLRVATIDTMLSLWLAMLYDPRSSDSRERIYCMAQYLFEKQKRGRLRHRGPLRRFGPHCLGEQTTLESVRAEKSRMHDKLQNSRDSADYDSWFLNYRPAKKSGTRRRTKRPKRRRKKSLKR